MPDVEAARLRGFGRLHIIRRHILPDFRRPLSMLLAFGLATVVLAISTLSFVNIGVRPPTPEWGNMMTELLPDYNEAPLHVLMPAILLFASVFGLALVTDGEGSCEPHRDCRRRLFVSHSAMGMLSLSAE